MQTTTTIDQDQYLPARRVWERYGVTSMTLWRWLRDPRINFPKPFHTIHRRRFWLLADLEKFERDRCGKTVAEIEGRAA
jgi:predicted DNA-binding transcriptional regulator AlpA